MGTQGSLLACSCSTLVHLDCDTFGQCIRNSASVQLRNCLRCCALLFAHDLVRQVELGVDMADRSLPKETLRSIAIRALGYCGNNSVLSSLQSQTESASGASRVSIQLGGDSIQLSDS